MTVPRQFTGDEPRRFTGDEIVIATHNKGKIPEIKALFAERVRKFTTTADYGLDAPAETGTTFVENALIKAQTIAKATGKVALADDSGLCVDALGGAPGVYSADWAEQPGLPRDFNRAMQLVHDEMVKQGPWEQLNKKAHFVSCLALAWPDGHAETVEGYVHGTLVWPPRGDKGFGYDSMFVANDNPQGTYGEIDRATKEATNHRADAFRKLIARCFP
jgi:XTP/dITP diphosphohydrolase